MIRTIVHFLIRFVSLRWLDKEVLREHFRRRGR